MYLNIDNKITEGNRIIKLSVPNLSYVEFPFTIDQLEERYLFSNIVVSADFGNRLFILIHFEKSKQIHALHKHLNYHKWYLL